MDGIAFNGAPARSGITFLGDSNTSGAIFALPEQFILGVGPVDNYALRWTQQLATATGWRIQNYGQDGAQAEDFLGRGITCQKIAADLVVEWWARSRAKYYVLCFGLNETAKTHEEFRSDIRELAAKVIEKGGIPILMTNVSVFFDADLSVGWYNTNRNIVIDAYDDDLRTVATEDGLGLIDVNAAFKVDIGLGNFDHRVRVDNTFDDSADGSHVGDPDFADYRTNIHYNAGGATIVSDTIVAFIAANGLTET